MSLRTILVGVFALVFGVAAAIGVFLIGRGRVDTPAMEMVTVVVATKDIGRGQSLTADLVSTRRWPKDAVPEGAIIDVTAAIDRAVLIPLIMGEMILEGKLASKGAGRGMAAIIPSGMRAVTIQTPNISTGVAGFILPGNKVDVLLTVTSQGADDTTGGAMTLTLLQNIEILAVDQRIEAPHENRMDPKELRSITLLVTPADAASLDLGQNRGTLHLALRNPSDTGIETVEPATLAGLNGFSEVGVAVVPRSPEVVPVAQPTRQPDVPKPAPPEPRFVRTLRGLKSGTVNFPPNASAIIASPEELPTPNKRPADGVPFNQQ